MAPKSTWGLNFELGRGGANFIGNKSKFRNSSAPSWVSDLSINSSGVTRGNLKKGKVKKSTGSEPEKY